MELSSTLFARIASSIPQGQSLWAVLTINEYEVSPLLRSALLQKATVNLTSLPLTNHVRDALLKGRRLGDFSSRDQRVLQALLYAHRPQKSATRRFIPSRSVNESLARIHAGRTRDAKIAANAR